MHVTPVVLSSASMVATVGGVQPDYSLSHLDRNIVFMALFDCLSASKIVGTIQQHAVTSHRPAGSYFPGIFTARSQFVDNRTL